MTELDLKPLPWHDVFVVIKDGEQIGCVYSDDLNGTAAQWRDAIEKDPDTFFAATLEPLMMSLHTKRYIAENPAPGTSVVVDTWPPSGVIERFDGRDDWKAQRKATDLNAMWWNRSA